MIIVLNYEKSGNYGNVLRYLSLPVMKKTEEYTIYKTRKKSPYEFNVAN